MANIPATVEHDGQTYTVTAIDEDAFYNCTTLTQATPPALHAGAFYNTDASLTWYIPCGTTAAYTAETGQVYIVREGRIYTLTGIQVR